MSDNDGVRRVALIPAYNEEGCIAKVILQARQHVDRVVVCDDGSTDLTFTIAKAVGADVVKHEENRGKGAALRTLFWQVSEQRPDVVVILDGDGQHDADQIPLLMKPIEAGDCDLVIGSRYVDGARMNAPFYRRFGLGVINLLYAKVGGVSVKDTQSGFRAYSLKAFKCLMGCDAKGYGVEGEQLSLATKNGLRVTEVPITVNYNRSSKTSKKAPLLHGVDLISTLLRVIMEERPLAYLGLPGLGFAIVGMILGLLLLWTFNATRYFSLPYTTLSLGASMIGLLLIIAAIMLHGLKRLTDRLNRMNQHNI
ncbi:MAG: glycosyltransferase family 2 protein [Candidatus Bathyarchaeota archaeon]|nr:MAG: glycosyltransferase family 2 protein [Candidatus Bathyarchaeota archaeon]